MTGSVMSGTHCITYNIKGVFNCKARSWATFFLITKVYSGQNRKTGRLLALEFCRGIFLCDSIIFECDKK
jgi:hypothetical protein